MKTKPTLNPIKFAAVVHTWSREKFIAQCGPQFPDHDLEAYADEMGLISEAVAPEAPPAIPSYVEGGEVPGVGKIIEPPEDTATSKKPRQKTKGGNE